MDKRQTLDLSLNAFAEFSLEIVAEIIPPEDGAFPLPIARI
jgi:hypothetical protein